MVLFLSSDEVKLDQGIICLFIVSEMTVFSAFGLFFAPVAFLSENTIII